MSCPLFCRLHVMVLSGVVACALLVLSCGRALHAQIEPAVGSQNVAIADPPVPRPGTTPCIVQLFHKEHFGESGTNTRMDAAPHPYTYQPPDGCKGPWSKIVFEADFFVDAGHQYDRTVSVWLNGVNLYFGTTEEPSPAFGPSWHVERDLTDYASLLRSPGKGAALVNNWLDSIRGSMIYGSARVLFYPANDRFPAPSTPDAVYSLSEENAATNLQSGKDQLLRKLDLPQNTARVYLDLLAQSQFHDEFWYTCLPDQYVEQTSSFAMRRGYAGAPVHPRACNGGAYREAEVSIDGQPAGLAPIYPWVYTGGIDPYLWRPTPGVQTLTFVPYRLDLTPFAGVLSDGAQHSIAVQVIGANQYFSVAAALLVYRDPKAQQTKGAITRNTLAGASLEPTVSSTLGKDTTNVSGDVLTRAEQRYIIEGYVETPAGRVNTRVEQHITFANTQKFTTVDAQTYRQVTEQTAHVDGTSDSTGKASAKRMLQRSFDYALTRDSLRHSNAGGSSTRKVDLQQNFDLRLEQHAAGQAPYHASVRNTRIASAQATFDPAHRSVSSNQGQSSKQTFAFNDSLGNCYQAEVQALDGKVSSYSKGQGCAAKPIRWFVHPDGSPDSFGWRTIKFQ